MGEQVAGDVAPAAAPAPEAQAAANDPLLLAARAADADMAPAGAAAPGAPVIAPAEARKVWVGFAMHAGRMARATHPTCRANWTDDKMQELGEALARCAVYYKWEFSDFITHPLAGLAMASMPLLWPFVEPIFTAYMKKLQPAAPAMNGATGNE